MPLNRYYEDELAYLRDLGDVFAKENPKLASFLSRKATDPDVERLLEGFAFLTASLRQRLDDHLPELVHGMLRLIWPPYLQPIAPLTTLRLRRAAGSGAPSVRVPRGAQVRSRAVDGVSCPFQTCYDVDVLPFEIQRAELENTPTSAELRLTVGALPQASFAALAHLPLRLHLASEREPLFARTLSLWMQRQLVRVIVRVAGEAVASLPPDVVAPVGFDRDEAVLAQPANEIEGYRLLQEYLTFPQKFLYLDIGGLGAAAGTKTQSIELAFIFDRPLPPQIRVSADTFCLNCTPAANLFPMDAAPLQIDLGKTQYRVRPIEGEGPSIHAITSVTGYVQGHADRIDYVPFESFRHDLPGAEASTAYYRQRVAPSVVGRRVEHYISFVNRLDQRVVPRAETISLTLTGSNGRIAERLPVGAIDQPGANMPNGIQVENIARVMGEVQPPLEDALLWRLVAGLACSFNSIADIGGLRQLISSFDFRAVQDDQARRRLELLLDGLEAFEHGAGDLVLRGTPIRIRHYTLVCQESKVGGEAEMFLLGTVLNRMLNAFATVNSMHQFSIRGSETNVRYTWAPTRGIGRPL
ncbi:type VI secretion system baseplate subunit TssF [Xanthobacteraceae bacterium A53D]